MNGLGGGAVGTGPGGGLTYLAEDEYDKIYSAGSSSVIRRDTIHSGNASGIIISSSGGASKVPTMSYASNSLAGSVSSSMNPLSSLHGLTNQPQLIPTSSHHVPLGAGPTGLSSSFGNAGNSTGLPVPTSSSTGATGRNPNNVCCLIDDGRRCHRIAGNASYSKRVQKTVFHKRLRLENDTHAQHIYICDYHKMIIQNARTRQKKDSDEDLNDGHPDDMPEVDLYQLQVNTLRRYKKHYKISSRPGLNKAQLAEILMKHFKTIPVQEKEVVAYFIYMVKSERNKLDNNRSEPTPSTSTQAAIADDRFLGL